MGFYFTSSAAVVVGADTGLIHAGDESRAIGRTNGGRDEGAGEFNAAFGHGIEVRCLDGRLAVGAEVRRHVVRDNPNDVGARG